MRLVKFFGRRQQRALLGLILILLLVIFGIQETFKNNCESATDFPFIATIEENETNNSYFDEDIPIKFAEPPGPGLGEYRDDKIVEQSYVSGAGMDIRNLPEQPYILGRQVNGPKYLKKPYCARFPSLHKIAFNNIHWQVETMTNGTFYFFNAYYDNRKSTHNSSPSIRILAMVDQMQINGSAICQLWFKDESSPVLTWVREFNNIWQRHWSKKGAYNAFLITCKVPKSHNGKVPDSVSIVEAACSNATNNIRIHHHDPVDNDVPKQEKFGVCVKGLDMLQDDKSIRLIEWIELLNILGADKIFFYEFMVHPNIKKILNYYVAQGKADVVPLTLPGNLPNDPRLRHLFLGEKTRASDKRKNEVIPYNDCLYRNLDKFKYLAVLDTDEIILPKSEFHWSELINNYENKSNGLIEQPTSSWCFRNVYFLDGLTVDQDSDNSGIPKHLHMLQHVYRSSNYTPPKTFIKCIHDTETTLTVHNHFPFSCLGRCKIHHFDPEIAHMQHYRSNCVDDIKDCKGYKEDSVLDTTVWKYKEKVVQRVSYVMNQLGIVA